MGFFSKIIEFFTGGNKFNKLTREEVVDSICSLEKELIFEVAKNKFNKKNDAELEKNLKFLRSEKQKLLSKLGIKKSDLTPKFECEKCKDIGFVGSVMCDCFKARRNDELLKQSGLNLSSMASFENYNTKICTDHKQAESLDKLKNILVSWAENYPSIKKRNIIISGTTGVGKSYLSECLANKLATLKYSVCFVSSFDMNNMFLKYHTTFDSTKNSWLEPLVECDMLFIDDLGTEPVMKNVTLNYLFLLLSERERFKRPIIITTNLLPENILDRYGERIYSRLNNKLSSLVLYVEGDDLRLSK